MVNLNNAYIIGIVLSVAGSLLFTLKEIPKTIYEKIKNRYIHTVRIYQYDELFYIFEWWLRKNYKEKYRDIEASVSFTIGESPELPNDSKPKQDKIFYKQENNVFTIKYKGKLLVIEKDKQKLDKQGTSLKDLYFSKYHIYGYKACDMIDELLLDIVDQYDKSKIDNTVRIFNHESYGGEWFVNGSRSVKTMEHVIINNDTKKILISDVDEFEKSKDIYKRMGIDHKRGYLFYGGPGGGKTSLAFAIAHFTNRNIFVLNLSSLSDDMALARCFKYLKQNSVLLIEDIDAAFTKRNDGEQVSFSMLLNCLDGAMSKEDIITIITTNHIEKLDPALIRSGRIDLQVEIKYPTSIEIKEFLLNFYSDKKHSIYYEHIKLLDDKCYHNNLSMADIQDICLKNKYNITSTINQISKLSISKLS